MDSWVDGDLFVLCSILIFGKLQQARQFSLPRQPAHLHWVPMLLGPHPARPSVAAALSSQGPRPLLLCWSLMGDFRKRVRGESRAEALGS